MNWRLKNAARHIALALPGGAKCYRWLTSGLLGTNSGMAAKWFRVFPTHIRVMQEQFGDKSRAVKMWCFDSGATMAAGLAIAIATDQPGLLTDRWNRLLNRYREASRRQLQINGAKLAELSGALPDRIKQLLRETAGHDARQALNNIHMTYSQQHATAEDTRWKSSIGCVFSAGTLEHYPPEELEEEIIRMLNVLCKGGVMSHVVDHRDHRWHADKRISPLQHLTFDEEEYHRRFNNPLDYHNRWLRSNYVELFERHSFRVECRDVAVYTPELAPLDRALLSQSFRRSEEEDLRSLVTHFVAVRL